MNLSRGVSFYQTPFSFITGMLVKCIFDSLIVCKNIASIDIFVNALGVLITPKA